MATDQTRMFNLYERKIEPGNEYSSTAEGSHENIHRAKARTRPYPALIQEVFSQTLSYGAETCLASHEDHCEAWDKKAIPPRCGQTSGLWQN